LSTPSLVHVYTGEGKGKTTAALGLAVRNIGHGNRAMVVQFLKSPGFYNECRAADRLENLDIFSNAPSCLVFEEGPREEDRKAACEALEVAGEALSSGRYGLVVLDEITIAIRYGLVRVEDVVKVVKGRAEGVEVVLTGRYAQPELLDMADYITEMRCVRHPYERGILSRSGIDK